MKIMIPRGIRNCNPLNIRRSRDQWKGLLKVQNDKIFYQFKAMEWGYRAAFRLLRTYRVKYNRYSVRTIIERWAPPSENQTRATGIHRLCVRGDGGATQFHPERGQPPRR